MELETNAIPQADMLWDVALVPEAILNGKNTADEIGEYIGAKGQRQGLYYAQAAVSYTHLDVYKRQSMLQHGSSGS